MHRSTCRPVLTVPPDTVADSVLIAVHDLESGNRSLVPVLNTSENSLDVVDHGNDVPSPVSVIEIVVGVIW
jgi:hypothetical protein